MKSEDRDQWIAYLKRTGEYEVSGIRYMYVGRSAYRTHVNLHKLAGVFVVRWFLKSLCSTSFNVGSFTPASTKDKDQICRTTPPTSRSQSHTDT